MISSIQMKNAFDKVEIKCIVIIDYIINLVYSLKLTLTKCTSKIFKINHIAWFDTNDWKHNLKPNSNSIVKFHSQNTKGTF